MAQQQDRHLTTEQLSASLDQQLSAQEQAMCDAHLSTCQQCQQMLADLRQTVALVRALPQQSLPRSFVLPANLELPARESSPVTSISEQPRRVLPYFVRSTVRAVSTLAAVLGIIFLLAGVLGPLFSVHGGGTAAPSSTLAPRNGATGMEPQATQTSAGTTPNVHASATCGKVIQGTCVAEGASPTPQPTPSPTPTNTSVQRQQSSDNQSKGGQSQFVPPDISTPQGRLGVGGLLLLLSVVGFILAAIMRKRVEAT